MGGRSRRPPCRKTLLFISAAALCVAHAASRHSKAALRAEHDQACGARFPVRLDLERSTRQNPRCWSARDAMAARACAMPEPLEAVRAAAVARNQSSQWSSIVPMYVAGFLDATTARVALIHTLRTMRESDADRAQRSFDEDRELAAFAEEFQPLKSMLGNHELRHASTAYHLRHALVSDRLLDAAPPVHHDDMAAWRDLHDAMGGKHWHRCSRLRDDPCRCAYVFCSPRRMPGGGAALADPAAEAALAEDEDADDAEADEAGLAWRAEAASGTGSSRDGSRWTLRVTLLTLVEEPMLVGALPASLARMEGLRGLVLTNMGGVVSNACSRRFATTVLGRLRLRMLVTDTMLPGLWAHDGTDLPPLPLVRWLRSLTLELGAAASVDTFRTAWSPERKAAAEAGARVADDMADLLAKQRGASHALDGPILSTVGAVAEIDDEEDWGDDEAQGEAGELDEDFEDGENQRLGTAQGASLLVSHGQVCLQNGQSQCDCDSCIPSPPRY